LGPRTRPSRHRASRKSFEQDRARDAALTASGLRVLRITWRQLVEQPEAVIARVAAALAAPARLAG
jgi:very-short-patch-repair endonuclease